MNNIIRIVLVFFSAATIIIADALIKQISADRSFLGIIKNPWMLLVYFLYLIQIFLAIAIFIFKGELAIYSNLFIVFYGVFGVCVGVMFFGESLGLIQIAGISLGLIGAVLMNLK